MIDPNVAVEFNQYHYTPVHMSAMNGHVQILEEFLLCSPRSLDIVTGRGETVFHLSARFDRYNVFTSLVENYNNPNLLNQADRHGSTVLHLTVSAGSIRLSEYIISNTTVDVNCINQRGQTALDILNQRRRSLDLKDMLKSFGGRTSTDLFTLKPKILEIDPKTATTTESPRADVLEKQSDGFLKLT